MSDTTAHDHRQIGTTIFSWSSFLHGLVGCAIVVGLMGVWMAIRESDTLERAQHAVPSKTVIIERTHIEKPVKTIIAPHESDDAQATPLSGSDDDGVENTTENNTANAAPANENALPRAPIEGLYETRPEGQLPLANMQTGQTPFSEYKKPAALIPGRPTIAIVFVGGGLSGTLTHSILSDLPEDITLSISPYASGANNWFEQTRAEGHEVWMTLPLQTDMYPDPDPGPYSILSGASMEQNQSRILNLLARGTGYAGLISLPDHSIKSDSPNIEPVIRQIFGRGLAFVDGRTDRPFFAETIARENAYPFGRANAWIGDDQSPAEVKAQLADAERYAQASGQAIVFVSPSPASINAIKTWSETLEARGLQLAPLSALIHQ